MALVSVVRNAVKYNDEHSRSSVLCETTADLLKISVLDQGPGVERYGGSAYASLPRRTA